MKLNRLALLLSVMLLFVTANCSSAFAQATASGTIQGTVTDKSGGVMSGVEVVATSKTNSATRTTVTAENGSFRFELMPADIYVIKVGHNGFASTQQTSELMIGQTITANFELKPGSASEVIEVTSEMPLVDETKTSVSQNITPSEVAELPMIGRDAANLAYLAPGVKQADSYDPTKARYAVISVNGQGGREVNLTVNGIDNKDNTVGGPVMQLPLEAVEEFVISTQRFSAANGKSEGAAINLVTKSGSNDIHGSGFGFFRNEHFNANDFFSKQQGNGTPPYSRQFFGGSIGAPIKKDKLFGFFALERQREHTNLVESPDAFTELSLVTALGAQPAALIPTPFFETRYNARLDYRFNDRESAYLSFSSQVNNSLDDQSTGTGDLSEGNFTKNHLMIANLTFNSILPNSWVNSFTVGYQYWNNIIDSTDKVPLITFGGGTVSFGTNANVPQQSYQKKWQFRDDATKSLRAHTLRFGVDFIDTPTLGGFFESNSTLEIDFVDLPSVIAGNTNGLYPQKFATPGAVVGMSASSGNPYFNMPGGVKQLGLYFQDDWKVTRRLTLDLGIRWDKDYNLIGASAIQNSRTFEELTAIGSPFAKLPHDDNKDFSPRLGFAYDLTGQGRHVLRGGFGLYYGNIYENIPLFMIQQSNPTIYQGLFSLTGQGPGQPCSDCTVPGTAIPLSNWRFGVDPLPTIPPPLTQLVAGSTGRLMDPLYRNPYSEEFNFGYQWAATSNSVVEVEYIHVLGLHQEKSVNLNPTIDGPRPLSAAFASAGVPVLGRVIDEQSINRTRYDGLNFSYRRRMTKRFSVNANYTLSRAVGWDIQSGGPNPGTSAGFRNYPHDPLNLWDPRDFGDTQNDERHHVTISGIVEFPWGFQFSPILQYGSARPFDLNEGYDVLARGSGYSRPLIVPNGSPTDFLAFASSSDGAAARACIAAGQCHQVGYDTVRGDPFFELDARVAKNIRFGERKNLQLLFQMFNLTNKTNFGNNYVNTATSSNFLKPLGYINPGSAIMARAFQGEIGARFTF
ncbi:MAG TPA: TonB-dependent receptor [Candidatus Acidoferrum sp.]|jgi:hypothetical protein